MRLRLPLKPSFPLRGNERIALAPFILVTEADKARDKRLANVDLQGEFHRFLKKQLEKKTKFEVIETPADVKLPDPEPDRARQGPGVLGLASARRRRPRSSSREASSSGSRTAPGYKTEEYVSPIDGRTYYRQVYVEQSGFLFDIVLPGLRRPHRREAAPGRVQGLPPDRASAASDELQGLFENLFSLENQILNIFVARDREADRYIFTD